MNTGNTAFGYTGSQSTAECMRILGTLRVCDLQDFLQEFGQTKSGRKQDLVRRCQNTLHQVSPEKALTKLKDLSRRGRRGGAASPLPPHTPQWTTHTAPESSAEDGLAPFAESPFFKHMACIVPPTPLVCRRHSGVQQETCLSVPLTEDVRALLASDDCFVHLRFCPKPASKAELIEDEYPKQLYVRINSSAITIPNYAPRLSMQPGYKYQSGALDVTAHLQLTQGFQNRLSIVWMVDNPVKHHYVLVHVVRRVPVERLLEKVRQQVWTVEHSNKFIQRKLSSVNSDDVSATSLRVSLLCPLGKVQMTTPVRGTDCDHLQCFDALVYLQMNERRATWSCVVCDKPAPIHSLMVDSLMYEVLQCTADSEVEFDSSGSWHLVKGGAKAEMDVECKENVLSSQPTFIDLTGSDDEDTSTLSLSPIVSTANCLKELLSGADSTLQPERSLTSSPFAPSPHLGCLDRSPQPSTANFPTSSVLTPFETQSSSHLRSTSPNPFSGLPYLTPPHLPPAHITSSAHLPPSCFTHSPYLTSSSHPTPSHLTPSSHLAPSLQPTPSFLLPSQLPTSLHAPSPPQFPSPSHTPPINQILHMNSYSPDSGNNTSCSSHQSESATPQEEGLLTPGSCTSGVEGCSSRESTPMHYLLPPPLLASSGFPSSSQDLTATEPDGYSFCPQPNLSAFDQWMTLLNPNPSYPPLGDHEGLWNIEQGSSH